MITDEQVSQQQNLLSTYRRNLAHLLKQAALRGGEAFASPQLLNEILEARNNIRTIKKTLHKWDILIDDDPNDGVDINREFPIIKPSSEQAHVSYDTSLIRDLLKRVFIDNDLRAFIYDYFRELYVTIQGKSKSDIIQMLIQYCENHNNFDALFDLIIRERNTPVVNSIMRNIKEHSRMKDDKFQFKSEVIPDSDTKKSENQFYQARKLIEKDIPESISENPRNTKRLEDIRNEAKYLVKQVMKNGFITAEMFYLLATISRQENNLLEAFDYYTTALVLDDEHILAYKDRISLCNDILSTNGPFSEFARYTISKDQQKLSILGIDLDSGIKQ